MNCIGDWVITQKCYMVDFLSKKRKANEGEVPQYYVEGSHDAIIEPVEWQLVQMEIQRRKNLGWSHNCCSPFSAKLKCGDCGEYFGSKVWHSNSKYKRTVRRFGEPGERAGEEGNPV